MNYQEALKQVKGQKKPAGYLMVSFDYNSTLILPHKEGTELVNALQSAEKFKDHYNSSPKLVQLGRDALTVQLMSEQEYHDIKMAQLLNIPLSDVRDMREKECQQS